MEPINQSSLPARAGEVLETPALGPYYLRGPRAQDEYDSSGSQGEFLEYWRMLRRHKTALILWPLAGLLVGFGVGLPMKPVYRARTSLEVLSLNEDFMNMKQSNPVSNSDDSYDVSETQNQSKLLESDSLMKRVLAKLNPRKKTPEKPVLATSGWRKWMHMTDPTLITPREALLGKIAGTLKVHPTTRTRILEATVESTSPQLAADFANTLVEEFIQQNLEARFATTHRTSDWLTREIDDARDNLKKSENALQAYASTSGLIFTDENTNVATEKLQQLQQQLSAATADRITRQARLGLAKNSPPDTLAEVLNDDGFQAMSAKVTELRQQVADLSAVYSPEFSKRQRAEAQLAVVEAAFEQTRADIVKRIENDFREAADKEKLLASAYDAQTREVTGQDEKAIQYNILKREVDSSRQLYDTMLQQTKQSSVASALRSSNVRLVDPAEVPTAPFSPNFKLNSGIGFLAGLFLCIAFVTIRERADRTLQQPGDVKLWTNLIELGTIPSASTRFGKIYRRRYVTKTDNSLSVTSNQELPSPTGTTRKKGHSVELITWQQQPSLVGESFRFALTSILFVGENGSRPRVLVITSADQSDGKTTVVSNLAIATAEIRRKVLVIDADLRRPRLHDIFDVPNVRGLSDILREELSEESIAGLIQETIIPNLHVLPAGPATNAAAHLLYSRNFAPLLAKFRAEYDMILIDTPPMLQMSDARVAGRLADAVVLVARSGQTTRDALLVAKERLDEDSIRILGTVLNDWNPKRTSGGYYGQYRDHYYKYQAR